MDKTRPEPREVRGEVEDRPSRVLFSPYVHFWNAPIEPDVYYLVANKYGPSLKTVIRRPPPSSTSPPIDDDFDAATTRGANTEWSGPVHRLEKSRSPLPPDYARATITKGPIAGPSVVKPQPATPSPRRKDRDEARALNSDAWESRDRELYENHGDYGCIMNELERKFGAGPDLTLSPTRSRREQDSSGQAVKATITTTTSANATGISRIGYPARLGSVGRTTGVGVRHRHSLEMVDRRVLESGPERTVTISTWREQVAHEADQQANMDIYYLDARDYAAEEVTLRDDGDGDEETDEEEASSVGQTDSPRARKMSLPLPPPPLREGGGSPGSDPGSIIRTITDEQSESGPVSQVVSDFETQRRTASPVTTSRKSSSHSSRRRPRSRSGGSGSQPGIGQPTPPQTPPRPVRGPMQNPRRGIMPSQPTYGLNGSGGGSRSSPGRVAVTLPRQIPDHSRPKAQPAPRSSTPNRIYMRESTPSFHPTRSGSTISTIKSASTVALEHILDSCDPSLLHLAPALARLGIRNDVHLHAIARLSDETRDRELRDAALKEGITVMDWAILLDKLQVL
ncbi:hypothetical protein C0989_012556 [Termitomyces sp. Mn162]|nr:hypothetical protein C0989_012556 [Termitomyces sp. Mn162]